jgi:hypothetical protein
MSLDITTFDPRLEARDVWYAMCWQHVMQPSPQDKSRTSVCDRVVPYLHPSSHQHCPINTTIHTTTFL